MLEEVVRARDGVVMDGDVLLGAQLVDQLLHGDRRHHLVAVALDDDARGGAGREEGEVVEVGGRRDRDEALDLRPAHQELHADPRAEADAGDPRRLRLGWMDLHPVERGGRVGQLADAVVEHALALADAAEVEAQRREAAAHERLVERLHDMVVHRAAGLRDADGGSSPPARAGAGPAGSGPPIVLRVRGKITSGTGTRLIYNGMMDGWRMPAAIGRPI